MATSFGFRDYLRLRWLSFVRAPRFHAKLVARIFFGFIFLLIALEFIGFGIFPYYFVRETFPPEDPLVALNRYVYIYLVIAFIIMLMMNVSVSGALKPFLLLPVRRRKILRYFLIGSWLNVLLFLISLWIWTVVITFVLNGYDFWKILPWAIALQLTVMIFSVVSWFTERSGVIYFIGMSLFILLMFLIKRYPGWLRPLGKPYEAIAEGQIWLVAVFLLIFFGIYFLTENYLYRRFYAQLSTKKREKIRATGLRWTERFGISGAFIQNDIRLILRNKRPRMLIFQAAFMILYAVFIFGSGWYENQYFMYVFAAIFLTGVFLINYGSFIPAWESEHFNLLVSQSIDFRKYLEAKWLLMNFSVLVLTVLSVPFLFFGEDIFYLILAFALFNAGVGSYWVLWSGIFNKMPVKINASMQEFRSAQNTNFKLIMWGLLRVLVPILLYVGLKKMLGTGGILWAIAGIGVMGILLKNPILNALASLYNRHKYAFVESFSKSEES